MAVPPHQDASPASVSARSGAPRRNFALFRRFRFQMPRGRPLDICLDTVQNLAEGAVYLLGPFLIVLALGIVGLLSYTFFFVLLPMIMEKYASRGSLQTLVVLFHSSFVVFLLVNILFNYAMCVLTKNDGPMYDRIVRELATVTGFSFPETPAQVAEYRRDFEDRMVIRMRRRRAREEEEVRNAQQVASEAQNSNSPNEEGGNTAMHHRNKKPAASHKTQNSSSTVVRKWMLMGPYEWGFCGNSMQPKPPRSHYDHVTRKLVLNLDVS